MRLCTIEHCNDKHWARGYCGRHYYGLLRNGIEKPLYARWQNMIRRCHAPKHPRYPDWGGRGIKVCPRWRHSYQNFEDDMLPTFKTGLTLDRVNNDGDYEPNNVRWVTMAEQAKNKRSYPKNRKTRV